MLRPSAGGQQHKSYRSCLENAVLVFSPLDAAVLHRRCFTSPYYSSDKLSGLSASSPRRCDLHVHLKISVFNPTLKLPISINFNHCYLKRKCYTLINGSNNCAQYAIWLPVTAFVNYMIPVVARTGKSCYYHFKIISIYSANLEAEQRRVAYTRVTPCNILHCSKTANNSAAKHISCQAIHYAVENRLIPCHIL